MTQSKMIALTVGLVLLTSGAATPALADSRTATTRAAASPDYSGLGVTGYVEAYTAMSDARLQARSGRLTSVGIDGINLTRDGRGLTSVSSEARRLLARAHADGDTAELLVGNFSGDDFSPTVATRLLASAENMDAVAAALAAEVRRGGWDGVQVDLEALDSSHTAGLTTFMEVLREALDTVNETTTLSIAIMATGGSYTALGYDPAGIARSTDTIVLMAYDQHGYWEPRRPGPVGGTPWVEDALGALLDEVPAGEVTLGIAGYGYTFPRDGQGRQVSPSAARRMVARSHGSKRWSGRQQEWRGSLGNGTRVWWSDARTVDTRIGLAQRYGLAGVAIWSLGLADILD